MKRYAVRLDVDELQVESFATGDGGVVYGEAGPALGPWGSVNTQCQWSNCCSEQVGGCETGAYGGACPSIPPNCGSEVSFTCPV